MPPQRGAFVDSRGIRWDPNNADYEGFMSKKSRWMGEWRKRYMILKGSKLFFAADETAAPHGMIDLIDCISIKSAETKAKRRYALEIELNNESYVMAAGNEREKDAWISQISRTIVGFSSMYVQEDMDDGGDDRNEYENAVGEDDTHIKLAKEEKLWQQSMLRT
mmetsp:Transcript_18620/g.31217  ORF Transcript_18620/g.31217 Transcript_18620/m.31217 type:complete len:164 (+) Transcript_18620:413-904(+)|eukprot:CAMPEP_0174977376 /NCGR_PEP_ID=MMETSP0004_2-20121128/13571_1 /TAXON_ID=420556 /ORGANISM="Ochromonas sp., Strain CCMP1393" /LENGTH=163 /DNA_ID=CAMNT_0016228545 /DNA_START=325 /DNA_END=816 /DNA_ORIENTATION=-